MMLSRILNNTKWTTYLELRRVHQTVTSKLDEINETKDTVLINNPEWKNAINLEDLTQLGGKANVSYLIDADVANSIVSHALPLHENQLICESNSGLGLITKELLKRDVKRVRLYETAPALRKSYPYIFKDQLDRIEIFNRDFFNMLSYHHLDRHTKGVIVNRMLRGVPKHNWDDPEPAMTIFGTNLNKSFIQYLIMSVAQQSTVSHIGRIQLYIIVPPTWYLSITASPKNGYGLYRRWSILFQLFCDYQLLEKYPKTAFTTLPKRTYKYNMKIHSVDADMMYLVRVNFKRNLPVPVDQLISLLYFISHFLARRKSTLIPTYEKWFPGCGMNIINPSTTDSNYPKNVGIFTEMGTLTPAQHLAVFKQIINNEMLDFSAFNSMMEQKLQTTETMDTVLDEELGDDQVVDQELEQCLFQT